MIKLTTCIFLGQIKWAKLKEIKKFFFNFTKVLVVEQKIIIWMLIQCKER